MRPQSVGLEWLLFMRHRVKRPRKDIEKMARPARFELATLCLEGRCSIQLSYGRTAESHHSKTFPDRIESIRVGSGF